MLDILRVVCEGMGEEVKTRKVCGKAVYLCFFSPNCSSSGLAFIA